MAPSIWNRRKRHAAYRRIIKRDLIAVCFHPSFDYAHPAIDTGLAAVLEKHVIKGIRWLVNNFTARGAFRGRIYWLFKDTQIGSLERQCFHLICKKIRNMLDRKTDHLPGASMDLANYLNI